MSVAAQSETHKEPKEREPRSALHATVNPDTLPFTYAKEKHVMSFVVENTGDATQIFKIKTTASYLYRIRPVYFKLPAQERQEVNVTYKGMDAGPIPMSGKDRITIVFAHALDARKSIAELWDLHKPYANLSYAESREYVRVLFVDANGRLVVTEKSRISMVSQPVTPPPRSITMRPDPPSTVSAPQAIAPPQGKSAPAQREERAGEEKPNNSEAEGVAAAQDPPPQVVTVQARSATPKSGGMPRAVRTPGKHRSPSPNSMQQASDNRRSPLPRARSRDPIETILTSATSNASHFVYVQYGKKGAKRTEEDGSTYEDEDTKKKDENTNKKEEDATRKRTEDTRREELLKKKNEGTRKREEEEQARKKKAKEESEEEKSREAVTTNKPTSNEEVKQDSKEDQDNRPVSTTPRRRKLGPDGKYIDDDSDYLAEEAYREKLSVRLVKKGATGGATGQVREDGSYEDDKPQPPPQPRSEEYYM